MLEPIVQQNHFGTELHSLLRCLRSLLSNDDNCLWKFRRYLHRLIATLFCIHEQLLSIRYNHHTARLPLVASTNNCDTLLLLKQILEDIFSERGLSCSANRKISNGDNRNAYAFRLQHSPIERLVPQEHNNRVQPRKREKQFHKRFVIGH